MTVAPGINSEAPAVNHGAWELRAAPPERVGTSPERVGKPQGGGASQPCSSSGVFLDARGHAQTPTAARILRTQYIANMLVPQHNHMKITMLLGDH